MGILSLRSLKNRHPNSTGNMNRFNVTRVDESTLKPSQNFFEPIYVRPRWVDYLFIPPPPKKDCLGRTKWLNKPIRRKTSIGRKISNKTKENLNRNVCGSSTDKTLKPNAYSNIEDINLDFKDLQDLYCVYAVEKTIAVSIAKIHIQIHQTVKPRDEKINISNLKLDICFTKVQEF